MRAGSGSGVGWQEFRRMVMWLGKWFFVAGLVAVAGTASANEAPPEVSFERDVRPILKAHCFHCHGEDGTTEANLDLRLRRLIVEAGGKSGAAVVLGQPDESRLYQLVRDGEMPKGEKRLAPTEVETIKAWIAGGARTLRPEPAEVPAVMITEEERAFWAFQPVRRPEVPAVAPAVAGAARNPIDAFLLAKLAEKGLTFSPEADRRTLIRRATFNLLGLPPTPDEVTLFLADTAPDAYERLIDRLLADPRYGERWGRHWLDVAGYAESDGAVEADTPRPFAHKYRDYVIRAFNVDKPFDEFVREQLAGDELIGPPPYKHLDAAAAERLAATGFLRMAPDGTETDDQRVSRGQAVAETVKVVGTALLGLTVGCAQCHDHRYDPIPQVDYTRLRAVFDPAFDIDNWRKPSERLVALTTPQQEEQSAAIEAEAARLDAEIAAKAAAALEVVFEREILKVPEDRRALVRVARGVDPSQRTPEQSALLREFPSADVRYALDLYDPETHAALQAERAKVAELRATKPPLDAVPATTEVPGQATVSRLFFRGDVDQPKQEVTPGELTVLALGRPSSDVPADDPALPTTGRRLAYAKLLTDGTHPLVGRVLVNRVWMHHFGRGIVATPGDFGLLGERPTHPELLDWLASDFVEGGWRLKRLHKLIMTSTAYRQTSRRNPAHDAVDPENRLIARQNLRRLEAEAIRDTMLATAGRLNPQMFGPSVPVGEDTEARVILGRQKRDANDQAIGVEALGDEQYRRSLYVEVRRKLPLAVLETFDMPQMTPNCESRRASTVAPQSLMFMNDAAVLSAADDLAKRLAREAPGDVPAQVRRAWALLFSAEPSEGEVAAAAQFLADQNGLFAARTPTDAAAAAAHDPQSLALAALCQALLSSNRFLYVD